MDNMNAMLAMFELEDAMSRSNMTALAKIGISDLRMTLTREGYTQQRINEILSHNPDNTAYYCFYVTEGKDMFGCWSDLYGWELELSDSPIKEAKCCVTIPHHNYRTLSDIESCFWYHDHTLSIARKKLRFLFSDDFWDDRKFEDFCDEEFPDESVYPTQYFYLDNGIKVETYELEVELEVNEDTGNDDDDWYDDDWYDTETETVYIANGKNIECRCDSCDTPHDEDCPIPYTDWYDSETGAYVGRRTNPNFHNYKEV